MKNRLSFCYKLLRPLVILLLTFLPDLLNAVDDEPKKNAPKKKGKRGRHEAADETEGDAPDNN